VESELNRRAAPDDQSAAEIRGGAAAKFFPIPRPPAPLASA
jgi:hypothetical protein